MIIMRLLCHKNEKYKIEEQNDKKAWKWDNETRKCLLPLRILIDKLMMKMFVSVDFFVNSALEI